MTPTMTEIELMVEAMFEESKTDVTHAQCIQYEALTTIGSIEALEHDHIPDWAHNVACKALEE